MYGASVFLISAVSCSRSFWVIFLGFGAAGGWWTVGSCFGVGIAGILCLIGGGVVGGGGGGADGSMFSGESAACMLVFGVGCCSLTEIGCLHLFASTVVFGLQSRWSSSIQ